MSNVLPASATFMAWPSLRSAMMFFTRRPRSCRGRRCSTVTECSAFKSSPTSILPMNRVPPMTRQFMRESNQFRGSVVILLAQVRDQIFAAHPPESVFQLHELDEDVMLRVNAGCVHRRFEVEREPFLNAAHAGTLRQIHEQHQVQNQRSGQNRIAAQKIDLDLHRIAEPSENIDIIPAFLRVAAR